ncbi:MAG: flavodoxin family protein [Candidatus Saccharibacteria bacterium]
MKALVVYEGNTEKVGQAICDGLKQTKAADVECKAAGSVGASDLQSADYIIVGAPSSGFLVGRKAKAVVKNAVAAKKTKFVLFDTRAAGASMGMAQSLAEMVKGGGGNVVAWTYFGLGPDKALMGGEESLAKVYGANLATMMK